jgi:putative ABC transport system ATP-binding protein
MPPRAQNPRHQALEKVGMGHRSKHLPRSSPADSNNASPSPAPSPARPAVLLADEPTGNLDSKNGDAVMALLADSLHRAGSTIVMVTHDTRFARHAERTIHVFDGRVVEEQVEAGSAH